MRRWRDCEAETGTCRTAAGGLRGGAEGTGVCYVVEARFWRSVVCQWPTRSR